MSVPVPGLVAMPEIPANLQAQDTVIVYINAHGFSDDGKAFLAHSNFRGIAAADKSQGRVGVSDFLESIQKWNVRTKLVIFDSGRFPTAPPQGMFVNEFPWLLEKAFSESQDRSL